MTPNATSSTSIFSYISGILITHMLTHKGKTCVCDVCNKAYANKKDMVYHKRKMHTKENLLQCDECDKRFASPQVFKHHKMLHTSDLPHPCPQCPKKFALCGRLKQHVRQHHSGEERPMFPCDICQKTFTTMTGVWDHIRRRHSEETPFHCTKCEKKFKTNNSVFSNSNSDHPKPSYDRKQLYENIMPRWYKICAFLNNKDSQKSVAPKDIHIT